MKSSPDTGAKAAPEDNGLIPLYHLWQPRYWGLWTALLLLRVISPLPFRWQMLIGKALGRLAMPLVPKRRRIAEVNLRLCFPDLDDARIETLVREHFESTGMSMIEMGLAWFISDARARRLVRITGGENARREIEQGHAVILLSGHFSGNEIIGIGVLSVLPVMGAMYRAPNNALADQVVRRSRHRSTKYLIPKDSLRQMLRLLKKGVPVWYASDQAYDRRGSALVPFFGVP
ncbi:MAG: lipid A biosynthesis lauroyl acyltransferase, partial [Gammaproteobacteria bacterium]|nr:lipid A biosynthesis lauroyl acyltransferase [Gammaproteobacteria bacterium]